MQYRLGGLFDMKNSIRMKNWIGGICLFSISLVTQAQESLSYEDYYRNFKAGLVLHDHKNWAAAEDAFEAAYLSHIPAPKADRDALKAEALYYMGKCEVENALPTAELTLLKLLNDYPESVKSRLAYFQLGRHYYQLKKYNNASDWFERVNAKDLSNEEETDFYFMMGYSLFTAKKLEDAKKSFGMIKDIQGKYYYPANYYYGYILFQQQDYREAQLAFEKIKDSEIYKSVLPFYLAQIYYFRKDFSALYSYAEPFAQNKTFPYHNEMNQLLGQARFENKEFDKAVGYLEYFVKNARSVRKEDMYQLAYACYQQKQYVKAVDYFKELNVVDDSLGQNATYALADCYLKLDRKEEARAAFQQAAKWKYDDGIRQLSMLNYAKLSYELAYYVEALNQSKAFINLYPKSPLFDEVNELLVNTLLMGKDYELALKTIEELDRKSPKINEAYQSLTYRQADESFRNGKKEEALKYLDKSLKTAINPTTQALAYLLKADVLYSKGEYKQAIDEYRNFFGANSKLAQNLTEQLFYADYGLGYCYYNQKDYNSAQNYFGKCVTDFNRNLNQTVYDDASLRLADCYLVQKDYVNATSRYQLYASRNKNNAYALYQLAKIQGYKGDHAAKIETLNKLVNQQAASSYADEAYLNMGDSYYLLGKNSEAIASYQKIISAYPNSQLIPTAYSQIGLVYQNMFQYEKAIENYQYLIRNYSKTAESHAAIDRLKEVYKAQGQPEKFIEFMNSAGAYNISASAQDSLYYQTAEDAYTDGDCANGIKHFTTYLSKFPNGYFATDAHYFRADCYMKQSDFILANKDLESVVANKNHPFYSSALSKAAFISYHKEKNISKAAQYYELLYASTKGNTAHLEVALQLMRCYEQLSDARLSEIADDVLNHAESQINDKSEAQYYKAKAAWKSGNFTLAQIELPKVLNYGINARSAECAYYLAQLEFNQGNYQTSLDACFEWKNKYAEYDYWLVKTFILIADNYSAQNNFFQAKATLQSIIDNYNGELLPEAKAKLQEVKEKELQKSKIEFSPEDPALQPDTLDDYTQPDKVEDF